MSRYAHILKRALSQCIEENGDTVEKTFYARAKVSNFEEHKTVDVAVRALRLLRSQNLENLKLMIARRRLQERLLELTKKLDLRTNIQLLG